MTGSNAQTGDATWNERHFNSTPWAAPGGIAGADYANDPSANTSVGGVGSYLWGSSTELISDAQLWLADPATNFGFILVCQAEGLPGTGRRFASREQLEGGIPARLELTYIVPEPCSFAMVAMGLLALGGRCRRAVLRD